MNEPERKPASRSAKQKALVLLVALGLPLVVVATVMALFFQLASRACPPPREKTAAEIAQERRDEEQLVEEAAALGRALEAAAEDPCASAIRFEYIRFAGGWGVTCDGCAWVPADRAFSKADLSLVDMLAVDGSLTLRDLMVHQEVCR